MIHGILSIREIVLAPARLTCHPTAAVVTQQVNRLALFTFLYE
jgi:hypothetical protein